MKLEATNHSYYCSETNYYVDGYRNHGRSDYDTWQDFKEAWLFDDGSIDHDYNHCFRFDILETHDEDDNPTGGFYMWSLCKDSGLSLVDNITRVLRRV